jgi:hypothetical protein
VCSVIISSYNNFSTRFFSQLVQVVLRCINTFGISISMFVNIVLPKVRRVMSGEKVVLTHLLNQGAGGGGGPDDADAAAGAATSPKTTMLQSTPTTNATPMFTAGDVIRLKREDPLPPSLEREIFVVQGLLGQVSKLWYVRT